MSFESTVKALCVASAPLTTLVPAGRITFNEAPQGVNNPFIVFTRTSTIPVNTMDEGAASNVSQTDNVNLQASIYGVTLDQSVEIARVLRRVLTNEPTLRALCTGIEESYESDVRLRGQIMTFSCWYVETLS
jgi:hypothetical protein